MRRQIPVDRRRLFALVCAILFAGGTGLPALARQPAPAGAPPDGLAAGDWAAIHALLPAEQQAYFKASQVSSLDQAGWSVAVSGDTAVVGAANEDSSTPGVQNTAAPTVDENGLNAGAAYVFVRNGATWSQQAYLKASQVSLVDQFGWSVAISGDTIVVGASGEDSGTTGVQNGPAPTVDESAANAGAAYVFVRNGTAWSQQAYLKAPQVTGNDQFGWSVAVSGDTIVVGAPFEDGATAGVQNDPAPTINEGAESAGAAYVFVRNGAAWSQQTYLKASQVSVGDQFGRSVAVSGDTAAVGMPQEDGGVPGVQNDAAPTVDESVNGAGAAAVFARAGAPGTATWGQQAYLKAAQVSEADLFGWSVAISGDAVVVGATGEDSGTAGVQNGPAPTVDESAEDAGAAFVFARAGERWRQQAYLKASQVTAEDSFGASVAISGGIVVVGASFEDSGTAGVQLGSAPTVDESARDAGAAFVFAVAGVTWGQQAYLKASQVSAHDQFGASVAVAGDTALIGAYGEDGGTTGVQNGPAPTVDESVSAAGAAYGFAALDLPAPTETPTTRPTPTASPTPTNMPTATATPALDRRQYAPLVLRSPGDPAPRGGWLAGIAAQLRQAAQRIGEPPAPDAGR